MPPPASSPNPSGLRIPPLVRRALAFAFVVLALLGILETRLRALRHVALTRRLSDEAAIPSPTAVRLLSLGHREWAADLLWSSALVYYGETMVTHQQQRHLQRYAEAIQTADPGFRQAYLWGATVSIYSTRIVRRASVEGAIANLQRGLRVFPDDGEMLYQLGFNYFFELPPLLESTEERQAARRRGAEYLRRAAALGYGPQWLALAAAGALERAGMAEQAMDHLRELYLRTEDPAARRRLAERIEQFARERGQADPALDEMRRLEAERRASLPYVPPLLYLFVGPPVPEVVGTDARGEGASATTLTGQAPDADAGVAPGDGGSVVDVGVAVAPPDAAE